MIHWGGVVELDRLASSPFGIRCGPTFLGFVPAAETSFVLYIGAGTGYVVLMVGGMSSAGWCDM